MCIKICFKSLLYILEMSTGPCRVKPGRVWAECFNRIFNLQLTVLARFIAKFYVQKVNSVQKVILLQYMSIR